METRNRQEEAIGDRSRRQLAELQERVLASDLATVVLVEGLSDAFAFEAVAARCGRDLPRAGVGVFPMGGATNVGRFLRVFGSAGRDVRLAGLCDVGEAALFARQLGVDRSELELRGFFVCDRDLEDELIRALGRERVEELIAGEGDLASLRSLQQMPAHRHRTTEEHLHRFMGVRSGRKYRYAALLAAALDPGAMPRPLQALLDHVIDA